MDNIGKKLDIVLGTTPLNISTFKSLFCSVHMSSKPLSLGESAENSVQ